jgi:osmoprotectant transport system substrate-binding protein
MRAAVIALVTALVVAGCGLQSASGTVPKAAPGSITHHQSLEGVPITVAAKDFTEQLILGNMLSIILEVAGADVTNMTNIPGSFGARQAMLSGTANVSPEYTGTGWINYMGHEDPIKDPVGQWKAVDQEDRANGLTWLQPSPMNNTYAFAIRESEADRLGVTKLSDLARLDRSELTFCVESEFASRNDGFEPMLKTYGLSRAQLGNIVNLDT